jgi:hypothetical protein
MNIIRAHVYSSKYEEWPYLALIHYYVFFFKKIAFNIHFFSFCFFTSFHRLTQVYFVVVFLYYLVFFFFYIYIYILIEILVNFLKINPCICVPYTLYEC